MPFLFSAITTPSEVVNILVILVSNQSAVNLKTHLVSHACDICVFDMSLLNEYLNGDLSYTSRRKVQYLLRTNAILMRGKQALQVILQIFYRDCSLWTVQ